MYIIFEKNSPDIHGNGLFRLVNYTNDLKKAKEYCNYLELTTGREYEYFESKEIDFNIKREEYGWFQAWYQQMVPGDPNAKFYINNITLINKHLVPEYDSKIIWNYNMLGPYNNYFIIKQKVSETDELRNIYSQLEKYSINTLLDKINFDDNFKKIAMKQIILTHMGEVE